MTRLKLYKAKMRAAQAERRQWAKAYHRAERGLLRVGAKIYQLGQKIAVEEAKQ
jgi:hypothetical protein